MSTIILNRFIDAPRVKREIYASGRIKYQGISRAEGGGGTSQANWSITKYSDENTPTDQQTLENAIYDDRDSLSWDF